MIIFPTVPIKSTPSSSQQRNLSKFMENVEGPFAMLRKCRESGNHAKIYIRNNKTIVGHTMGRIIAFDKHMNIILEDATETFKRRKFKYSEDKYVGESKDCSQRLLNLGITLPESKVKSVNRKNCIVSRYVGKVLIRCECIALII
uniref:Sm domain-containing protein n=1 Tax=Megaselia scalaris TaxID=36166 RepID=T1GE74_MEGSC